MSGTKIGRVSITIEPGPEMSDEEAEELAETLGKAPRLAEENERLRAEVERLTAQLAAATGRLGEVEGAAETAASNLEFVRDSAMVTHGMAYVIGADGVRELRQALGVLRATLAPPEKESAP